MDSKQHPLNYFNYSYVEVDGKPWPARLNARFSYREVSDPTLAYHDESQTIRQQL